MKKVFESLIILLAFSSAACAHIVYTTENGSVGLITVESDTSVDVTANRYSGGENSIVASYWENNTSNGTGNSKIILITPKSDSDTSVSGDTAVRFASIETLSKPIDDADDPIVLEDSYGTPIICGTNSGGSVYLATNADLREYKTSDFRHYNTYTYSNDLLSKNPEIKAVIKNDYRVYVLVALNNSSENDLVIMLEGTLDLNSEYSSKWEVKSSKPSHTMNFISDSRIVVGCDDGVYQTSNGFAVSLVSSDAPVVAICSDTGKGFYYITQSESEGVKTNSLYHYTTDNTDPAALITVEGNGAQLVRDQSHNVLAVMIGEQISLIKMEDDTVIQTYLSESLGGNPLSITTSSVSGNSAETSSGCLISSTGLALMAGLLVALKIKKERKIS